MEINHSDYKILIVDDVMSNVLLLKVLLTNEKFQIATASNGKQALEKVEKENPDLILLDVMMPDMSGFEVSQHLKEKPETADIPIIFLTALNSTADIVKGFRVGANDFISKPFNKEELVTRVIHQISLVAAKRMVLSSLMGIPFCIHEFLVGRVRFYYVLTGYCGYLSLVMVFYSMLYLSICKDYGRISMFFLYGALLAVVLSLVLVYLFQWEKTYSMLLSLSIGFLLTASLEMAVIRNYFRENSGEYRQVLRYFRKYWKLVGANFLYTLGLYIHNFVFWTTDLKMVLVDTFVCCQPYDMASCLAMFTNISSSVIFIARTEMHFHDRYKAYSEAVIGGRGMDIRITKHRMYRSLVDQLMSLLRIQFIITVVVFLLCEIFLPRFGFGGLVMRIYPALSAGYFILYIMYAAILYLYYFEDLTGSLLTGLIFCVGTMLGAILGTNLADIFYGIGPIVGGLCGWSFAYFRLRWVEKNMDVHVFCKGRLLKKGSGAKPSSKVFDRYAMASQK